MFSLDEWLFLIAEVRRDNFPLINWSSYSINLNEYVVFLSHHEKFSMISPNPIIPNNVSPNLIMPNNERKRFIVKRQLIRCYNEYLHLTRVESNHSVSFYNKKT